MKYPYCNKYEITKGIVTPDIYFRNYDNLPVVSYTFNCPNCKRKTVISLKQNKVIEYDWREKLNIKGSDDND